MGAVEPTSDEKLERLRQLERAQTESIAKRLFSEEAVATADITGLVTLRTRIENLERLRHLRELTRSPTDPPCPEDADPSRSSSASAKETRARGTSRKRST